MKKIVSLFVLLVFSLTLSAQGQGGEIRRKPKIQTNGQGRSGGTTRRRSSTVTTKKYLRVDGYENDIHYDVISDAATFTYDVECSSGYEVSLLPSWCSLESKSSTQFVIRQEENTSSSERRDWFRVKATYGKQIDIYLTQAASSTLGSDISGSSGRSDYGYSGTTRTYTDVAKGLPSLTKSINDWGECKTGAITENGIGVVIKGGNGYSYTSGIPTNLANKLKEINDKGKVIQDIALSGSTWWVVVYDRNAWYGVVPDALKSKLNKFNSDGEEIRSVSINSNGDYTIVTDKHYAASNSIDSQNMDKALDKFGTIYSACSTPKGLVVCCKNGCFYSNIPTKVEEKIKETSFIPKVVKFTDSGTALVTDGEKKNVYYM
ncbi:MAG: BACON domain-containing protein [Prevotella sp.]|nr:BACON domain-containing protein [Prevotella sp.]